MLNVFLLRRKFLRPPLHDFTRARLDHLAPIPRAPPLIRLLKIPMQIHPPQRELHLLHVLGFEDRVLRGLAPLLEQGSQLAILLEVHAHLNPNVREPIADFCYANRMKPQLIREDEGFDRSFISASLEAHGGNVSETARALGLHRQVRGRLLRQSRPRA